MDHSQSEVSSPDEVRPPLRSTERITGADTSSKDVALQSMLATALDCVVGALEATIDPTGVTFHRVPGSARARMADLGLDFASMWTSGVRIEALTDASVLELDVHFMQFTYGMTSTGTTVDVVVDGRLRDPVRAVEDSIVQVDRATGAIQAQPTAPTTLRLDLGNASGERRVEVWLPAGSAAKLLDVRLPAGARLRPAPPSGPLWIHYGSSISQCSAAERPTGTWPAIAARAAGRSLMNLGLGGQCQLDQFMARAIRDLPAAAISLELGINVVNADTMRERVFISALHGFLDTVRDGHPSTPILIVTPILCPAAEQRPGPTVLGPDSCFHALARPSELADGALSLTRIRELLHHHVNLRRAEGDTKLHAIDGLDLFGQDDIDDLPDGLHPNADGYRRIGERFLRLAFGDHGARPDPAAHRI